MSLVRVLIGAEKSTTIELSGRISLSRSLFSKKKDDDNSSGIEGAAAILKCGTLVLLGAGTSCPIKLNDANALTTIRNNRLNLITAKQQSMMACN